MSGQVAKRLISVEEYHKMAEVGILKPDDRVELINGEIIAMSPVGSPHASSVKRITALFFNVLIDRDYKFPFYAASDVQECWVVDVENKVLEVYRELSKGKYQSKEIYKSGDVVKLSHFDFEVSVSKIVG